MRITEGQYLDALNTVRGYVKQIEKEFQLAKQKKIKYDNPILQIDIRKCGFSVRTLNALLAAEIDYIYELVSYKEEDILRFRNIGNLSCKEIQIFLESNDLSLGMMTTITK